MATIFGMCHLADKIQGNIDKKQGNKWYLRRAYHRALRRIKDKVKECHRKLALFLCENHHVVLILNFEVSRMVKHADRKIRSKTVCGMLTWGHLSFREGLKSKTELHPWCKIVEVDEAYASKTCEECGHIHQSLGASKVFRCPSYDYVADRDLRAAKKVLLCYLDREGLIPARRD